MIRSHEGRHPGPGMRLFVALEVPEAVRREVARRAPEPSGQPNPTAVSSAWRSPRPPPASLLTHSTGKVRSI
jgi:hypothetical protein